MRVAIWSDLHFETTKDAGDEFLEMYQPVKADAIIIAGDLCSGKQLSSTLVKICRLHSDKLIIYVRGNHEHWDTRRTDLLAAEEFAMGSCTNLRVLQGFNELYLGGFRFLGATLWFPNDPLNFSYEGGMADFQRIPGIRDWVYETNSAHQRMLRARVSNNDIVITHHLPTYKSVPLSFKTSNLNRFFVTPMYRLIEFQQPLLWVHGHTHYSMDYHIGQTRVICNSYGYTGYTETGELSYKKLNSDFNPDLVLDLSELKKQKQPT